ncbi:LOW QUALITY PROTEIN: mucin-17 [Diachasma alloeum]|nr:LOW QUALITY PROTEIN: mucin-17 [Diachasma alloeum]
MVLDASRVQETSTKHGTTPTSTRRNKAERRARSVPQVGLLESTARTFVVDGASTEYATQVVGKTLDNGIYTRILATSSRVFYDKDSLAPESASPYLVYPSRVEDKWKVLNGVVDETPLVREEITSFTSSSSSSSSSSSGPQSDSSDRENDIFEVRREFNDHQKFKPAKPRVNLPTYTVKQELTGAQGPIGGGYDHEETEARSYRPRVPKIFKPQAIRLSQKKEPTKPLATVTYHGFADFTTTVGDTVIVFSPSTAPPAVGRAATTIKGDATLRPDDGNAISIQPTNVLRGQDKTSDPLLEAINGRSSRRESLRPSVQQQEEESSSTKQTPILLVPTEEMKPTGLLKVVDSTTAVDGTTTHYKSSIFGTYIGTNYAQIIHTSSNVYFFPDEATAMADDYVTSRPEETEATEDSLTTFVTVESTTPLSETDAETAAPEENELTTPVEDVPEEVNSITVMKVETTTPMDPEIPNDIVDPQGRSIKGNTRNRLGEEGKPQQFSTKLLPSEVYKTFTYYTTFFIPDETNADLTTTSVRSREVVSSEVTYLTELVPSAVASSSASVSPSSITTLPPPSADSKIAGVKGEEDEPTTKREEIELIFKTLYTTYTYLTTFFQESTSSVSSREVVETNVVTQTIGPDGISGDVVGLFNDDVIITPTKVQEIPKTTAVSDFIEKSEDILTTTEDITTEPSFTTPRDEEDVVVDVMSQLEPSPVSTLVPDTLKAETKTYFTTYTYFTTIFVDDETEIETRTEVFSNIVTEPFEPTAVAPPPEETETPTPTTPKSQPAPPPEILAYLEALKKQKSQEEALKVAKKVQESVHPPTTTPAPEEPTTIPITTEVPDDVTEASFEDGEVLGSMITDVVSSSSSSDGPLLEPSMDKRNVGSMFEDQELSESNHHDVEPAPTLLLRTSYTTFTYFTTMYKGDASNVVSRLQTVTNIVTETIRPTPAMEMVEPTSTLPVTYFTTFTYWTTFYKGGDTITTSREETVSNIVTPGVSPTPTVQLGVIMTYRPDTDEEDLATEKAITDNEVMQHDKATAQKGVVYAVTEPEGTKADVVESSTISPDPTTYYTTFTYFTTSYIGNETVLNSRLETITSVAYPGEVLKATGRAIGSPVSKVQELETEEKARTVKIAPTKIAEEPKTGLISTIRSSAVDDGTTTHYLTDVYGTYIDGLYAQVVQSTTSLESHSSPTVVAPVFTTPSLTATPALPTGVLSLNKGSIVEADEVTTIYFTTSQLGTLIDGLYAKVIESTSSTKIDADKKLQLKPTEERHRTGLVRLIKGQIETNGSTIVYQSKVIGTNIEGRYAQIIESTSSYLLGSTDRISPTATSSADVTKAPDVLAPSPAVIQSSIPENHSNNEDEDENVEENEEDEEENEEEGEDDDGKTKKKSRLTFSSRKRTFTPVIRPFLSRSRPTFNPKRKGAQAATTITRTDITPTITATLAGTKSNRFASSRGRGTPSAAAAGVVSSSRRFSGRRGSSVPPQASSSIAANSRGRQSSRIAPSPTFSVNRRGPSSIRGSSARPLIRGSSSSGFPGPSSRGFRGGIRPSSTLPRSPQSANPTQSYRTDDQEDEANEFTATTFVTDETPYSTIDDEFGETITTIPVKTTTESSRRSTNPLLRFRRPNQLSRGPPPTRRTTTTPKPTSPARASNARSLNAPPLNNRFRGNNRLFPPRNFVNQPTTDPDGGEYETTEVPGITDKNFDDERPVEEIVDNDYEGSENNKRRRIATTTTPAPQRQAYGNRFGGQRRRVRRQASQLRSYQTNRYRRPGTLASAEDRSDIDTSSSNDESLKTNRSPFNGRTRPLTSSARPLPKTSSEKYSSGESSEASKSRRRPASPRVKPTPTTSSGRQFTLREKSPSSYKRTSVASKGNLRGSNSPRVRTSTRRTDSAEYRRGSTSRAPTRARSPSRRVTQRGRGSKEDYSYKDDGTITVTHYVPTQATIPIFTNGVTEHRNIITASPSIEVLGPERYNTVNGGDGLPLLVIASESSAVNLNGQTEVTRFLLHTTPTSRVSHTLTTVNGRRVSQSLIVPSTIYSVENVVSTIPAALPGGNAPLANILLSQLLLGQLGGQNALLGPNGAGGAATDVTPTTSYNTRTTSYVTTITKQRSTVIPLTFRGKEIFTTLTDSSTNVITATEFITDTVVVTPTAAFPNANLNSLLLLLQQQPQASQFPQQPQLQDPLFAAAPIFTQSNSLPGELERRYQPADLDYRPEEEPSLDAEDFDKPVKQRAKLQKKETLETSVVTLYVSGKRPGEFSTILSTVRVGEDSTASRKRRDLIQVQPSIPPSLIANSGAELSRLSPSEESINAHSPTQSLESVVGDYPIDELDADLDDYPGVRRKVVRIPIVRTTEKHKYTVVRRRPLVTYAKPSPVAEEIQQTSAPRRIVVTRVRSLAARSRYFSNYDANYYDEPGDFDVPKRHKVTITRTRKLKPTARVEPRTTPRRVVRKKLVNVRPIITPTPTYAIITTGFYGISSSVDSEEDYESEDETEGTTPGSGENDGRLVNDIDETAKVPLEASREIGQTEEGKAEDIASTTESTPVIITDHFFFPASDDEDEDYGEDEDVKSPEQTTLSNDQILEEKTTLKPVEVVSEDSVTARTTESVSEETTALGVEESEEQTTVKVVEDQTSPPEIEEESSKGDEEQTLPPEVKEESSKEDEDQTLPPEVKEESSKENEDQTLPPEVKKESFKEDEEQTSRPEVKEESSKEDEEQTLPPEVKDESSEENGEQQGDHQQGGNEEGKEVEKESQEDLPTTTELTIEDSLEPSPSPDPPESTFSNDSVSSSTTESSDDLTVIPLESSLEISPTSTLDSEILTVIPLESLISLTEEITPTSTIRPPDASPNTTTVVSSSPTPEEIEAGLSDELYLSLSRLNIPDISSSRDVEVEEKGVEATPTVVFSETIVTSTRLRTYTYVVTKLNGLETEVTSSTTVRPRVTTLTLTVPITITPSTNVDSTSSRTIMTDHLEIAGNSNVEFKMPEEGEGRRLNLATRIMSNGVEVIVAGPTPALRWENSNPQPTLTLSDAVVMMMPQEDPNEFVTKTCTTTFTYLNTITKDGTTIVSTDQQVVANTATEERHRKPGSESAAVTLEASPTLRTEVFKTTYTYLTLNAEHPNADDALGSSQKVIANTVTAPQHYLDMILEPSESHSPAQTNTYLSTRLLEKTFVEDGVTKIATMSDTITRLIITESAPPPPRPTSVTTTLTALDSPEDSLTDIMKTYYITYTYANTYLEKGTPVVRTNVATSTDVTVEKVPKKTSAPQDASPMTSTANSDPIKIFATKTYLTTFTYFTTLLQAGADGETSTTISSRSHVVENVVTESIAPSLLNSGYMNLLTTTHRSDPVQNIVTGSTIIFFDDEDQIYPSSTTSHPAPSASKKKKNHEKRFTFRVSPEDSGSNPGVNPDPDTDKTDDMEDSEVSASETDEVQSDLEDGPERPVSGLLSLGSLGINGLSALGPVITAMAGLLQGKPSPPNRRNDTALPTTAPPPPSENGNANANVNGNINHLSQITTQRSPIYIPVSEFADGDIEAAESQNIVTQLSNPNFIPETRHKVAASLVDGIPISPGEIITANSDVIIGKPGKLSPRPPQTYEDSGEVGGLKPPPVSVPNIPVHPVLEVLRDEDEPKPYPSLPQKKISDFLTKKTPPRTSSKHDILENDPLLRPPGRPNIEKYANPNINHKEPQWLSDKSRKPWSSKDPIILPPPPPSAPPTPSRIDSLPHVYHRPEEGSRPPWAQKDPIVTVETLESYSHGEQIATKRPESPESSEPIIHQVPHVIDRSTGQPLLVNIQPSQVANVVIPQGGTQALIFGDTSEPHISGQYFDDPSPYPEPEVGPGIDKLEDNLSHYMLPPPNPSGSFKLPGNNFVHTIPISNSKIQGNFYDIVKPEKTPSDIRLIQRPDIHGQSQGHVHTEILVHHSPDNLHLRQTPQGNQNQISQGSIYVDLSPPPPPRMDYHKPPVNIEHLPPRRSEPPTLEYPTHNFHRYNYHSHEKQINKTLENEVLKQKWKSDRHKTRLQHRPRPAVVRRPYPPHGPKIKFPGRPQPPKYPQVPIENLHKLGSNNNKETQENLPTGAIGYQHPLTHIHHHHHHVVHPQQPQVVQLPPDISPPEIQSFGQILPPENEPENWSGTQTEKTIDSAAEESEDRPMEYYSGAGGQEGQQEVQGNQEIYQEEQQGQRQEQEQEQTSSPAPVLQIEESHMVTPEESPSTEVSAGEGSNTQSDFYDYEVQVPPGSQEAPTIHEDDERQEHEDSPDDQGHEDRHQDHVEHPQEPPTDAPDYEVIEGVPVPQFDSKPSYEFPPDDTIDLKPPAEPPRRTSSDHPEDSIQTYPEPPPPGGHARPPSHWGDESQPTYPTRKNLTQVPPTYLSAHPSPPPNPPANKKYVNTEVLRKPEQSANLAPRPHPAYPYIITKPPGVPRPVMISSDSTKSNPELPKDRRPPRPIVMPAMHINKEKAPETLETAFQTNFASADDDALHVPQLPKTQHQQKQQSHHRVDSKVPSEDMMPPPQVKPLQEAKNPEDDDLKPPPADTGVLGMSPPPVSLTSANGRPPPKYIPLKDTNKVVGETPPPPPPSYSMVPPTYPRPTKSRPFLVQLLSQDMVPPPPAIESSRIEIATVRPAIAVSGSIQIGTAVATSHIPVMQDVESTIPIVHGTVDLPVVVDVSDLMKTITETRKPELISVYTVRPFETRQMASKVSVQPTQILTTLVMPTRIRTSPSHRETHKKITASSARPQVHITRVNPAFGRKSVILEGSRHTVAPRISPTPTKSLNHFASNSTTSRIVDITSVRRGSSTQVHVDSFTEMKPKAVTHFKTLTVTRTETSVVGSPPTTRTLLLTSTITSTIVETVTETLLRPTSVVVTSVTTVLQPAQSTASVYDTYNSPDNLDSIFVVMSDQNPPSPGAEEVEAEYGSEEEVSRDEQDAGGNEIHRVLSGGILGAPVVPSVSHPPNPRECKPECRGFKSEVCATVAGNPRCVCRPGFARMFPDRPCKPTYTYTMKLPLERVGREEIKYEKMGLNNTSSSGFKRLLSSTREALDRTLMQSDLRDIYRGVVITRFHKSEDHPAEVEFHVQLTDNAHETTLKETMKKYLMSSNYSLGGTHVFASPNLAMIDARDFDECSTEEGGPHHDCSPHAACFNIRGSYQCSCREGWADLSENPSYPGRMCSQAPLGCPRCNNKGNCIGNSYGQEVCECFPWHSGQRCQVNLKVLLIALVTTGAILLGLLGVCLALACFRAPRLSAHKLKKGRLSGDKRAMISSGNGGDTSSEGSVTDLAIPHHVPHVLPPPPRANAPVPPLPPAPPKEQKAGKGRHNYAKHHQNKYPGEVGGEDQRGLSVMIPRAKYRSMGQGQYKQPITSFSADEHKLISYLEGSNRKQSLASTTKEFLKRDFEESTIRVVRSPPNNGALVSAGFQVSATVTRAADDDSTIGEGTLEPSTLKTLRSADYQDGTSTLARSCEGTTIQATTKLIRLDLAEDDGENSGKQNSRGSKDTRDARDSASEGPITAERDLGSTLRLRHTPLYNPDRVSDRDSNFDSL